MLKKLVVLVYIVMLCSGCGAVYQNTTEPKHYETDRETKTFSETIIELNTPQKVYEWMQKNFKYKEDTCAVDEFRDAQLTYQLGYGDCDDYAVFASYVLELHGYQTEIVSVFSSSKGHSVCAWVNNDGTYSYLSNESLVPICFVDLENIAFHLFTDWKIYSVYPNMQGIERKV